MTFQIMLEPVVVIIGRFQPPHAGHYALIKMAKLFITKNSELGLAPFPIVAIVDGLKTREDKSRNPITADDRIAFMRASTLADGVKYLVGTSATDVLTKLKRAGYDPKVFVTGSDRGDTYLDMANKYYGETPEFERRSITFDRTDMTTSGARIDDVLDSIDDSTPIQYVSGTLLRHSVETDRFDKFLILSGLKKSPKLAEKLFSKMKNAMGVKDND